MMWQAEKVDAAGAATAASMSRREQLPLPTKASLASPAAAMATAAVAVNVQPWRREAKWAGMTFIGVLYIGTVKP